MIKVSVIVPVYNVELYLPKCLDSLVAQTLEDIEFIIVNDGTKDQSQAIIDEYKKKDNRILSFIKENGGLSDARNYGLSYARGKYVFFLDSDDYIEENALSILYNYAEEHDMDLILFEYNEISLVKNETQVIKSKKEIEIGDIYKNKTLFTDFSHSAWSKFYLRSLLEDNSIQFPFGLYYEDIGTTPIAYACAKKIGYIDAPLYNYIIDRPGNITGKVNRKIIDVIENLNIVVVFFKEKNMFHEFEPYLCHYALDGILDNLWKLKNIEDDEFKNFFINQTYTFLNETFKDWKKNVYWKKQSQSAKIYKYKWLATIYLRWIK